MICSASSATLAPRVALRANFRQPLPTRASIFRANAYRNSTPCLNRAASNQSNSFVSGLFEDAGLTKTTARSRTGEASSSTDDPDHVPEPVFQPVRNPASPPSTSPFGASPIGDSSKSITDIFGGLSSNSLDLPPQAPPSFLPRGPQLRSGSNAGASVAARGSAGAGTQASTQGVSRVLLAKPLYSLHFKSTRNNSLATLSRWDIQAAQSQSQPSSRSRLRSSQAQKGSGAGADSDKPKPHAHIVGWLSGGTCKFKGANRNSYEAGYQVAVRMFRTIEQEAVRLANHMELELVFNDFGQGRRAFLDALLSIEGDKIRELIVRVSDKTPIKVGGTRAPKKRWL